MFGHRLEESDDVANRHCWAEINMGTFMKQMEIRRAMRRWTWAYFTGYAAAAYTAIDAIASMFEKLRGHDYSGFSPIETAFQIVIAVILAILAWRIQRHLSISCIVTLFAFFLLSAITLSFEDNPAEIIGAWISVALLLGGVLSIRTLRQFRDEMLQRRQENMGRTDAQPKPEGEATEQSDDVAKR